MAKRFIKATVAFMMAFAMTLPSLSVLAVPETVRRVRDTQIGGERSRLFSNDWKFQINSEDCAAVNYDDTMWQDIDVPHDWLIRDVNNLYKADVGWYRKTFYLQESDRDKNVAIRFDGVHRDATVYVNGENVGVYPPGWSTFQFDITDRLKFGNTPNIIAVKVNYKYADAWWYTGAGIQRDVWLTVANPIHVNYNGTYISTKEITSTSGTAVIETEVINKSSSSATVTVVQTVLDVNDTAVATSESTALNVPPGEVVIDTQELNVSNPKLWGVDSPNLYTMKTEVKSDGGVIDTYTTTFGFRTIRLDPNEGLFLNGEYLKVHGVCLHSDLGALGAADNYAAIEARLVMMKQMGVNAIRTAHNLCDPKWIEICDRLGLLVANEGMVRWTTTSYFSSPADYDLRYLPRASANPNWSEIETRSWIRRDRNHPSVFLWSIGNEVAETQQTSGVETGLYLQSLVKDEDPQGNAYVTIASNTMGNANSLSLARQLEASGYNYGEGFYDNHHNLYPNMIIYGSETASAVSSRGIYHTPANQSVYTYPDNQVSSYGNSVVPWGRSAESAWILDRNRDFCFGQFVWTGYDYIGEPTPYKWDETKNSYFGIVDTAGLPKDIYYFYQSVWSKEPMVHLLPYWDSSMGEEVAVWAYSNAASVELFKDGVSLGRKSIDLKTASILHYEWLVPYSDGELTIKAYDSVSGDNVVATDRIATFGAPAQVGLASDRTQITADGRDLFYVTASILDDAGEYVATARNRVKFSVSGAGKLVGVDNGDSTDYDQYHATERSAFSGKVVAIVQSDGSNGPIHVTAESVGLTTGSLTVNAVHNQAVTGMTLASVDGTNAITTPRGKLKMLAEVSPNTSDFDKVAYVVAELDGDPTDKAVIDRNGVLTAFKDGQVRVTATTLDGSGISESVDISISGQTSFSRVTEISVSGSPAVITEKSGSCQLTATVTPSDSEIKNVAWTAYNKSGSGPLCAEVNNAGLVQARYDSTVTIRATALDGSGVYGELDVVVSGQTSAVVPINKISLALIQGAQSVTSDSTTVKLKAEALPNGSSGTVDWAITNADGSPCTTATIDGVDEAGIVTITAQRNGIFYVTASTKNGGMFPQVFGSMKFTATGLATETFSPYTLIKARDYDVGSTAFKQEGNDMSDPGVGGIGTGSWMGFKSLNFGVFGSNTVKITGGREGTETANIEVRVGEASGELLATLEFGGTGGWHTFKTQEFSLPDITGVHDLYFVSKNGGIVFYAFQFTEKQGIGVRDPYVVTKANTYDEGARDYDSESEEQAVGGILNGDYLTYKYMDFGEHGTTSLILRGGTPTDGSPVSIELRDGSQTGALLATLSFGGTKGTHDFESRTFDIPLITGARNICFVMRGDEFYFESFVFKPIVRSAYKMIEAESYALATGSGNFEITPHNYGDGPVTTVTCTDNDTLLFTGIDFGAVNAATVLLYGKLENGEGKNVRLKIRDGETLFDSLVTYRDGFAVYVFDVVSATGINDIEFLFMPGGGVFLFDRFEFTEAEAEAEEPIEDNIFLSKLTKASSNHGDGVQIASKAVDNDPASKWCAASGNYPQWLQVDLGSTYDIFDIDLVLQNTTDVFYFTIAVSDDPNDWNATTWDVTKTVIDKSNNTDTLRSFDINATGRYVRVTFTAKTGSLWAVIANIAGSGRPHNVALNKPTTASSEHSGQLAAMANNNIINDSVSSAKNQWCANGGSTGPHWWQTDFGGVYKLSEIELTMEGDFSYAFTLQGSPDGLRYTTIAEITSGGKVINVKTEAFTRYLRVYNITAGSQKWPVIQNIVAYGSRAVALPSYGLTVSKTSTGAKARLNYEVERTTQAMLFAAAYSADWQVLNVKVKPVTLAGKGVEELFLGFDESVAHVRAYLWDTECVPLCGRAELY